MKHRLATALQDLGVPSHQTKSRAVLQRSLGDGGAHQHESSRRHMGRRALARHVFVSPENGCAVLTFAASRAGNGIGNLSEWAVARFGSLDAAFSEQHAFELHMYKF